ncbi:uncharacterized protein LOC142165522 [Nicotiana tabacum]|uniref:Uncharacterized protein LOC142165522 n=1 Tax=Nicotiana tabacum TaxID=4097 RepID=A0AC58S5E6_TOBAC
MAGISLSDFDSSPTWIVDTWAINQMAGGDLIRDVLSVSASKFNLLSVSKLTKALQCFEIKAFRSDNGSEFFNSLCGELFKSHGIIHQSSCPYSPQQNRVVERRHRHILEIARAIKFQGHLPSRSWGCCLEVVVYIINRVPSTILGNKSPFEVLHNRVPSLSHLRVIGCLCYATTLPRQDKFSPRAIPFVLLGYGIFQKGYKLYDMEHKTIFISRDVLFHDNIFTFSSKALDQDFSFPIMSTPSPTLDDPIFSPPHIPDQPSTIASHDAEVFDITDPSSITTNLPLSTHAPVINPEPPQRKFGRIFKPPIWLKDFVVPSKATNTCLYPLFGVVSYDTLTPRYQSSSPNSLLMLSLRVILKFPKILGGLRLWKLNYKL